MFYSVIRIEVGAFLTNCWVYRDGGKAFLIDPGGDAPDIIDMLRRDRLSPDFIIITHGHFDHIQALPEVCAAFPRAALAIHAADAYALGEGAMELHCAACRCILGDDSLVRQNWRDMPAPSIILEEGARLGSFTVLSTPGHSKGSICLYHAEKGVLFSGDTLFASGIGRTDLPGGNSAELASSLARLLSLDKAVQVFPGHGKSTCIADEQRALGN